MWCPHCQAEVATEVAADGQSLLCTACGSEVRKVFAPSLHPETRSARELLDRWSAAELFAEVGEGLPILPESPRSSQPVDAPPVDTASETRLPGAAISRPDSHSRQNSNTDPPREKSAAPKPRPKFRVDAAHPPEQVIAPSQSSPPPNSRPPRRAAASSPAGSPSPGYRQDDPHARLSGPHFDLQAALRPPANTGQSESLWGQILAYVGVGVLTVGTVLVLWGYFGGLPNYASNGWLVATGGQMLLFLGVVTLISGGMQQTTHEVSRRVEYIGERIIRIEQSAEELLRGPHYSRSRNTERDAVNAMEEDEAGDDA